MKRLTSHRKLDIARNMLQTALALYINGGDRFSVLQLAGAVEEVISGHIEQRRTYDAAASELKTAREIQLDSTAYIHKLLGQEKTPQELNEIGKSLNFARNNIKHHDLKQPDVLTMDIDSEAYDILRRAVESFRTYTNEVTELMRQFLELNSPESSFGTIGVAPS